MEEQLPGLRAEASLLVNAVRSGSEGCVDLMRSTVAAYAQVTKDAVSRITERVVSSGAESVALSAVGTIRTEGLGLRDASGDVVPSMIPGGIDG